MPTIGQHQRMEDGGRTEQVNAHRMVRAVIASKEASQVGDGVTGQTTNILSIRSLSSVEKNGQIQLYRGQKAELEPRQHTAYRSPIQKE